MNTLFEENGGNAEEKGSKKIIIVAVAIALVAVLAVIALLSFQTTKTQVEQQALEGAFREGSPEFQNYTKKIVAQTGENTTKSPTAMGKITMFIDGTIRNFTGKTLTGLEIKVGVVDTFNNVLKEKTQIVIPRGERLSLENNQTMSVRVTIEGFEPDADLANIRWKVTAIKVE